MPLVAAVRTVPVASRTGYRSSFQRRWASLLPSSLSGSSASPPEAARIPPRRRRPCRDPANPSPSRRVAAKLQVP